MPIFKCVKIKYPNHKRNVKWEETTRNQNISVMVKIFVTNKFIKKDYIEIWIEEYLIIQEYINSDSDASLDKSSC